MRVPYLLHGRSKKWIVADNNHATIVDLASIHLYKRPL